MFGIVLSELFMFTIFFQYTVLSLILICFRRSYLLLDTCFGIVLYRMSDEGHLVDVSRRADVYGKGMFLLNTPVIHQNTAGDSYRC